MSYLSEALSNYYLEQGRHLPWRKNQDPYPIWLSEIMLQQTRIEAVIPYFDAFIEAFPTVEDLAKAPLDEVTKKWEGLGYYSRARNLKKAAEVIVNQYEGVFPFEKKILLSLPGIGEYTAAAIRCFAFDQKDVPVDGNLLRIFARLNLFPDNVLDASSKKKCHDYFLKTFDDARPSLYMQGLMELGERICLPLGEAKCEECPLACICKAKQQGLQRSFPVRIKPSKKRKENKTVLVLRQNGRYFYEKREPIGLLASLYGFPLLEGHLSSKQVKERLIMEGYTVSSVKKLKPYIHHFSHITWDMSAFLIDLALESRVSENLLALTLEERKNHFALPSAFAPIEADASVLHRKPSKN